MVNQLGRNSGVPMKDSKAKCKCGRTDVRTYRRANETILRITFHDRPDFVRCRYGGWPVEKDGEGWRVAETEWGDRP